MIEKRLRNIIWMRILETQEAHARLRDLEEYSEEPQPDVDNLRIF